MSPSRVAVVLPDLEVGGLQAMAVELAGALDRSRFESCFYTFDGVGPLIARLDELGLEHVHQPRRPGVDRGYAHGLAQRFVADGIGLAHCHNVTAMFHGSRAARAARKLPVLFTEHDREMPAPWRHRLLHRWLVRAVDRVAVVSAGLADELVRYEGFPARRTRALVNGIPDPISAESSPGAADAADAAETLGAASAPDAARSLATARAAARAALGWDERPVLLAVGSLTEVKNHATLIDVVAGLAPLTSGSPRLVIAGEGPLQGELSAAAAAAPTGRVQLLGRRSDIPRLLRAADVFVLPSHREGLSLSLIEAHAMGRPSVAFDVGGNGEVIVQDETGLLVPYPDARALGAALSSLLGDGDRAARMGQSARQRFLARFTHERMVCAYAALYDELLTLRSH